jgi:hypothetical protein
MNAIREQFSQEQLVFQVSLLIQPRMSEQRYQMKPKDQASSPQNVRHALTSMRHKFNEHINSLTKYST